MVYPVGGLVVMEKSQNALQQALGTQDYLRGHDEEITALDRSGRYLVTGQTGSRWSKTREAPVIIWDLPSKREKQRLMGLSGAITQVLLSHD